MIVLTGDLYHRDQVPDHFKELFIFSGYRHPRSSPKQCALSVFAANNETLNFWTHFLPAVYYWYQLYIMWDELNFSSDHYSWPMLVYLLCVCTFPITSAVAHIFNTMSDSARHLCFFFDYGSLSVYSLGTAIAYRAYAFDDTLKDSTFGDLYLYIAAANAVVCIVLSCKTRFMPNGMLKKLYRTTAFALPYVFDSFPILHRIAFCNQADCTSEALKLHVRQFFFATLAAFFYLSHYPERMWPGKFDILGHSHQIFHIFSVLASHDQLSGLLVDLNDRQDLVTPENIPSFAGTLGLMGFIVLINMAVMAYFTRRLYRELMPEDQSKVETANDVSNKETFCNGVENGTTNNTEHHSQDNGEASACLLKRKMLPPGREIVD